MRPNEFGQVTKGSGSKGTQEKIFQYRIVRFLAFLQHPSDENWTALQGFRENGDHQMSTNTPFLHSCHRGHIRKSTGCVNGVFHGQIGNARDNNEMRACAGLDKSVLDCPGHGGEFCIYTDAGGRYDGPRNDRTGGQDSS